MIKVNRLFPFFVVVFSKRNRKHILHFSVTSYSGAPAARRAAKRSPIIIEKGTTRMHRNRNPCNSFLLVKMASGMDHGRVRPTTTTTTTNNDVAQHGGHPANTKPCSLGLQHISLILDMHIMCNWQLSYQEIRWPVSRDHIAGSGLELIKVACFFEVYRWPSAGFRLDRGLMSA